MYRIPHAKKPKIYNCLLLSALLSILLLSGQLQAEIPVDSDPQVASLADSDTAGLQQLAIDESEPAAESGDLAPSVDEQYQGSEIALKVLKKLSDKGLVEQDSIDISLDTHGFDHSGHFHSSGFEDDFDETIIIPVLAILLIFGSPLLIVAIVVIQSYRKRKLLHNSIDKLIDKGMDIPPELFDSMQNKPKNPVGYLKKGVLLTAVGIGVFIWLAALAGSDVATVGLIPLLIGIGYIVLYKVDRRKAEATAPTIGGPASANHPPLIEN